MIYDSVAGLAGPAMHDIEDPTRPVWAPAYETGEDLLVTMLDGGTRVREPDTLEVARARAARELGQLSPRTKRFLNPQPYPVGLDATVHTRKQALIRAARGQR